MKVNHVILILIVLSIGIAASVISTVINFPSYIPDKLLMPIVGFLAIIITLTGLYLSSTQWQKSRLGNEVLKEQFKLIASFLDHIQKNLNVGFPAVPIEGKVFIGGAVQFSVINYSALEELAKKDRYIVKHFTSGHTFPHFSHFFNELNNEFVHNPLFPKELFKILNELDTASYFAKLDYAKNWFNDDFVAPEEQFVLEIGSKKECLDKKPLRVPYGNSHLKMSDAIFVYKKFNKALCLWLKNNHIDANINI